MIKAGSQIEFESDAASEQTWEQLLNVWFNRELINRLGGEKKKAG